jgi:hypothetical protein
MWVLATSSGVNHPPFTVHGATTAAPPADVLAICGFLIAVLTLVCWLHQGQSRRALAAFGICLAALAIYGFLQGAWPLGIIQTVFCLTTLRKAFAKPRIYKRGRPTAVGNPHCDLTGETRMSRMFGPQ